MKKSNEKKRCGWAADHALTAYHDTEYGRIVTKDSQLFELLCLQILGANRSFEAVMRGREVYRTLFFGFDIGTCTELPDDYLAEVAGQGGKNVKKVFAVRENAKCAIRVIADYDSFFKFVYGFKQPERLLAALKKYGFTQVGLSAVTGWMRCIGILEAHEEGCFLHASMHEDG